jgi:hypothetical protein
MLSIAGDLVSRAARFILSGSGEPALWAITVRGRVVGSLVHEAAGRARLTWFNGADRRLAGCEVPPDIGVIDDVEGLAAALSARLGAPVELQSLPV